MTKMAAMPIYGKNPLTIFFPGTSGTISAKLGMYVTVIDSFEMFAVFDLEIG